MVAFAVPNDRDHKVSEAVQDALRIKTDPTDFDRASLLAPIHDLYLASKDNQTFLRARFGLGDDVLKPYKATIERWLCPDVCKKQDTSVAKAKTDYRKAGGQPEGLAELMVFFCECAVGFGNEFGVQDEGYFDALVRMFGQAVDVIDVLPGMRRPGLLARLDAVRRRGHNLGYGVGDDMDDLLARHDCAGGPR